MHCEYFFIDNGCNWQAVEAVCKGFPQLDIVPSLAYEMILLVPVGRSEICQIRNTICVLRGG